MVFLKLGFKYSLKKWINNLKITTNFVIKYKFFTKQIGIK